MAYTGEFAAGITEGLRGHDPVVLVARHLQVGISDRLVPAGLARCLDCRIGRLRSILWWPPPARRRHLSHESFGGRCSRRHRRGVCRCGIYCHGWIVTASIGGNDDGADSHPAGNGSQNAATNGLKGEQPGNRLEGTVRTGADGVTLAPVVGSLLAGLDGELGDDLADVPLGAGEADAKDLCDLGVRFTPCEEVEDLSLALGPVERGLRRVVAACHGAKVLRQAEGVPSLWAEFHAVVYAMR